MEVFGEAAAWSAIRDGWVPLYGKFHSRGVSFEWHEFETKRAIDWAKTFHPDSVELCLNLQGSGLVATPITKANYRDGSIGIYRPGPSGDLHAERFPGTHRFLTVEYSLSFLKKHFSGLHPHLRPIIASAITSDSPASAVEEPALLKMDHGQLIQSLRYPPITMAARATWFESKAVELGANFFFKPDAQSELFCDRQKQLARDRCEQVIAILRADLSEPPPLEEIGKRVGCSHYYLSRTFSKEMGLTIAQYLRKLRMERAAELLKSGKFNVTQAAMEVGYSSLSHFSQAFHETFGCCPGLYGIAPHHRG